MKKLLSKAIAGTLVLSFGLMCIPESLRGVFADEIQRAKANTVVETEYDLPSDEIAHTSVKSEETYILSENVNLRNRYRKVYNLSDGTVLAEQYSTPIHYLDKITGRYEEIDNALLEVKNGEEQYYRNAANAYDVKIHKKAVDGSDFFEISKDGYALSFGAAVSVEDLGESEDGLQDLPMAEFTPSKINKVEGLSTSVKSEFNYSSKKVTESQFAPSVISRTVYNNFWNGVNLEYELRASGIDETITINKSAEKYSYTLKLNTDGSEPLRLGDGSVSLCNSDGDEIFRLLSPEMKDAQGKTSRAVGYEIIEEKTGCYLNLTADSEWMHTASLPVTIRTGISTVEAGEAENGFTAYHDDRSYIPKSEKVPLGNKSDNTENGAVLSLKNIALPPYYFLTSASLKYSYESNASAAAFEVCAVSDKADYAVGIDKVLPIRKKTLTSAEENEAGKANKVYTQVTRLELSDIKGDNISFGFIPTTENNISVYAEGQNAAVLSLQYDLNVGLNPNAVTEQFSGNGIENHVNVYTRNLTSVIDCMSVNSNYMPIQLQMVYNPTYDSYKEELCTGRKEFLASGLGTNFKLNLEQYCFRYSNNSSTIYDDDVIYIDGSGAVHVFSKNIRNTSNGAHLGCSDCDLTCVIIGTDRFTIYKNELPYMYFELNILKWVFEANKYLVIEYDFVNSRHRFKKVYNCLVNENSYAPSYKATQSVEFSYNNNNLLSSITSNYGETVSFTYDSSNHLTKVMRGSLSLASLDYDSSGRLNSVTDRQKMGYEFTYWSGNKINTVYGINTDGTNSSSISKATFTEFGTTRIVNITINGQETITHQYGFDSSARCESSYAGYLNYQDEKTPRNSVVIYNRQNTDKTHINKSLKYTEDFSQIGNGTFESVTGNSPTGWTVNTSNTEANYTSNNSGKALWLTANSTASRSYSFNNKLKTSYVLGFFAEAWGKDCTLKVALTGRNLTKTFDVSYYGQYYALIVFDRTITLNSGTIRFENLCSSHSIKIDNVTFSPIEQYTESVWDGESVTKTYKQVTQEGAYTCDINDYNQIQNEKFENYINGTVTTIVNTYSNDHLYLNRSEKTMKQGTSTVATETVVNKNTATSTESTITYTGADGNSLKTYTARETDIYGYPLKEIGVNGEKTYYFYQNTQNNYRLVKMISCIDTSTVSAGASHDSHTYDYVVTYTYNSYGECYRISDGTNTNSVTDYHNGGAALYSGSGQSWKTDVNVYGNPTAIYESGNSLKQIQYTYASNQSLSRATYNRSSVNQSYADYTYDRYGNLTSEKWYDKNGSSATAINTATYSYTYDYANYKQTAVSDGMSYVYQANLNGNPLNNKITVSGNNYNANYTYTSRSDGFLTNASYNINGLTRSYVPQYNNKNRIVLEKDGSDFKSEYTYDAMGRLSGHNVYNGSQLIFKNGYSYDTNKTFGSQYTVNRITRLSGSVGYGYDYLGRISRLFGYRTSEDIISYDKYNRLSSIEANGYNGTWYEYSYDSNNNLTEIRKREPNGPPVALKYITYSYNSKNQLMSYTKSGVIKYFAYDNLGNPIKYGVSSISSANNLVWTQGTKLASGNYNGNSFSYKYNADGLRYEKTVNGITTRQYLEGDKVIAEEELNTNGTVAHTKYYIYDQTGIAGMVYDGSTYYFEKNLFGDVTTIYNTSGSLVASYTYDLWGNITYGGDNGVGKVNPFRYRGYYYDTETGFYYLQSRYYAPEICRFISADNLELVPTLSQGAGQLNLYAYCNNNPVMYTDESGESIILSLLLGGLIGATIAGAFNAISQLCSGNSWDWASFGLSLAGGFVSGFISAIPVPSFAALGLFGKVLSYGTTFVLGGTGAVVGGLITGSVNSLETLGVAFAVGGVANVIARGVTEKIVNVKASKIFNQSNKAKSLAVQKLQGHPLNMGAKALKGNMRNAFKGVTQKEIANLLMKANPYLRLGIYSAISSSVLSGWY